MTNTQMINTHDYNAVLASAHDDLRAKVRSGMLPLVARIPALDEAVSAYVLAQDDDYVGKRAKASANGRNGENVVPIQYRNERLLDKCADLLMYEYLTWCHSDKMSIVDDPILSVHQAQVRRRREGTLEDVYTGGEDDITIGRHRGSDGVKRRIYDYMTPERDSGLIPVEHLDLYDALDDAGLTARQREVIDLVYYEGLTQENASERLGVSRQAVAKSCSLALAKITAFMAKRVA